MCVKRLFQKDGQGISKGRHFYFSLVWLSLDVHLITVYFMQNKRANSYTGCLANAHKAQVLVRNTSIQKHYL